MNKRYLRGPLLALAVFGAMIGSHAEAKGRRAAPVDHAAAARSAYYAGDMDKALTSAAKGGERWIAGLSAYRLGKFDDARGYFGAVATDLTEDQWLRSAAAFWAARSLTAAGQPTAAEPFLRMAAMSPTTFYGMIAQRQLALQAGGLVQLASLSGGYWAGYDDHPTPDLFPAGGFTISKALVYAMVRQESRFNPSAVSPAGAVGLMQLMPAAAAFASGDDNMKFNVLPLFDEPTNLRLGQDYFAWLLSDGVGDHDVLKALAAYNGGPGTLQKTAARVGSADSLTLIESLPSRETREYVEKVMASYWTYQKKFGGETRTLDALALGVPLIDYRLDQ